MSYQRQRSICQTLCSQEVTLLSASVAAFARALVRWCPHLACLTFRAARPWFGRFRGAFLARGGLVTTCGLLPLCKRLARLVALHLRDRNSWSFTVAQQVAIFAQCPVGFCAVDLLMHSSIETKQAQMRPQLLTAQACLELFLAPALYVVLRCIYISIEH